MKTPDVDTTAPKSQQLAITKFGKPLSIERGPAGYLFQIVMSGGGSKSPTLEGLFSYPEAVGAINAYISLGYAKATPPLKKVGQAEAKRLAKLDEYPEIILD